MNQISGNQLIKRIEQFAPTWLAEDGDPIGLHVGDPNQTVKRVLVTLDVRPEVVQEAIEKQVDFIFAHHPPLYRPMKRIDYRDPQTKMMVDLIQANIQVYAAHTNIDNTKDGMNDWLAAALGLQDTKVMDQPKSQPLKKLGVFVPKEHAASLRTKLTQAGAGNVSSNYVDCSYTTSGVGRFTPVEGANPSIGEVGEPEEVQEERLEFLVEPSKLSAVIQALHNEHPYEEPVFETFSLDQMEEPKHGLGRIGNLEQELAFETFLAHVHKVFDVPGLRFVTPFGKPPESVKRVAICGGDAGKYYQKAVEKGADVYITGDVYYHTAHDMQAAGLTVVDPGHHIEKIFIKEMTKRLNNWKEQLEWEVEIIPSAIHTDPFQFHHA